jgi:hypothetical protein
MDNSILIKNLEKLHIVILILFWLLSYYWHNFLLKINSLILFLKRFKNKFLFINGVINV